MLDFGLALVERSTDLFSKRAACDHIILVFSNNTDIEISDDVFNHCSLILGRWVETRDS